MRQWASEKLNMPVISQPTTPPVELPLRTLDPREPLCLKPVACNKLIFRRAIGAVASKQTAAQFAIATIAAVDTPNISTGVAFRLILRRTSAGSDRIFALFAVPDFLPVIYSVAHCCVIPKPSAITAMSCGSYTRNNCSRSNMPHRASTSSQTGNSPL